MCRVRESSISEPEEEQWDESASDVLQDVDQDSEPEDIIQNKESDQPTVLIHCFSPFILQFQALHNVSDKAIGGLLAFLKVSFTILAKFCSVCLKLSKLIPSSFFIHGQKEVCCNSKQ